MPAPDMRWDTSELESPEDVEFEWEHLTDTITEFMKEVNPGGRWYASVENFGWQHLSGETTFDAETGKALLQRVLPRTECTFDMWLNKSEKKITINNAHHDAPTGGEMYYITPTKET